MHPISCNSCNSNEFKILLKKKSNLDEEFQICKCKNCGLVQVNPQPSFEELSKYYSNDYFTNRSDRGYDNYYSDKIKTEIERVFVLNLQDLDFFNWEKTQTSKNSLDIGCAAGYFVSFMKNRNWNSSGIEIADEPVRFGKEVLKLNIHHENFLNWDKEIKNKFQLITLWASIEHLQKPKETLEKIFQHLEIGGRVIISTCRYGILAKWKGLNWRFLNVPEHLYYYSRSTLLSLVESVGFMQVKQISYGSGMTSKKNAGFIFKYTKKFLDWLVKFTNQGDMIAIVCEKRNE